MSKVVEGVAGYPNYSYYYGIVVGFIQFVTLFVLHCEAKAGLLLDSMQQQVNLVGTHWLLLGSASALAQITLCTII